MGGTSASAVSALPLFGKSPCSDGGLDGSAEGVCLLHVPDLVTGIVVGDCFFVSLRNSLQEVSPRAIGQTCFDQLGLRRGGGGGGVACFQIKGPEFAKHYCRPHLLL